MDGMMKSCFGCDHYSRRDRWCSALEDRVIYPDHGKCSAHSRGVDACCTCGADDEEQCDFCALNGPDSESEDGGDEELPAARE